MNIRKRIKMIAVAYARFSSSNQRDESIDAQLRAIREYCEKNDIELVEVYTDEAVSGKTAERDNFQKMVHDIISGTVVVDIVLVHKFNRFARNKFDSAIYKKRLKDKGIRVVSVTQTIEETPEGDMLESFLEAIDQYYSANLALEVQKGIKENAINCKPNGGVSPLGLSLNDKGLFEPNEQAYIVQRIFTEYANGTTKYKICEGLNNEGIKNQKGKPFNIRTMSYILQNEKYIGNYIFTINGQEVIRHNGKITPIIDRDLWERAQKMRKKLAKPKVNKLAVYHLTGKAFCQYCGQHYTGGGYARAKKNGVITQHYRCASRTSGKKCNKSTAVNKLWLERVTLNAIFHTVLNDEKLRFISQTAYDQLTAENNKPETSIKSLKAELKTLNEQEIRVAEMYKLGKMTMSVLDNEMNEINSRKHHTENELKIRQAAHGNEELTPESVYNFFKGFIKDLQNETAGNEDDFKRAVFNTFVDKVEIAANSVTVHIKVNFPNLQKGCDKKQIVGAFSHLSLLFTTAEFARPKKFAKKF